jgi:tetratricopeptide (TPR) repeat protein
MLKQRFDRMLNLLSKNRNAALVEAKLIEGKMGDGLIAAQLRKGNYQKAYELFSKAIESQDKADAELAKQQAIFAEKKALKQTPGAGGGKGGGKVKISDIPSDMRADLKKAGDAVYNLNNITSTLSNEHLMIAPSASVADAILLAIERGGDVAQLAKNLTGKDIKPETVNWWKSYREYISKVRNQLYGATLTANEQADFERFIVTPATDRQTALQYFENQKRTLRNAVERKVKETQAALEAETAEDLVRGVAGITSSPQAAGGPRVPTINTPAEYDALPPGAEYIDAQTNKRGRKPQR